MTALDVQRARLAALETRVKALEDREAERLAIIRHMVKCRVPRIYPAKAENSC